MDKLSHLILFHNQILYNKRLAFGSILTHVKFKQFLKKVLFAHGHPIEANIFSNEITELFGRYLSQTFETGYLRVRA